MPRGGERPGAGRPQQNIHLDAKHALALKKLREQRAEASRWRKLPTPDELVADLIDEEHERISTPLRDQRSQDHSPDDEVEW